MSLYHLNPRGDQKQKKLGEVNRPPTPSAAEKSLKPQYAATQKYYMRETAQSYEGFNSEIWRTSRSTHILINNA